MVRTTRTKRTGPMLVVLMSAMFLAQFDFFVVNVAAPSFARDLQAGPTALELIVGGYAFAYATGMITGGRLGDLWGHRRAFVAGMVGFAVASLLCGLAQNPTELVLARMLQGLAGALMVPQVLAIVTVAIPQEHRGRALGWYGVASGLGSIAGQVLGGLLLDLDLFGLGWRIIFLFATPICAVAAPLAWRLLPASVPDRHTRLDLRGAIGVSAALALILAPLTISRPLVWLVAVAAVPIAVVTLRYERRLGALGRQPLLDLSLLRVRSYRSGLVAGAAFMAYFASFMFTLTLLLQDRLGYSALQAGLVFAPMGVLFGTTSLLGFRLIRRYGSRVVAVGAAVVALGLLLIVWEVAQPGRPGLAWLMVSLLLVGGGNGLVLPQILGLAMAEVRADQAGAGSGLLNTTVQFAGSAGVAAIGAAFFAVADSGYDRAMVCSALLDAGLMLVVFGIVARLAFRGRRATATV